MCFMNPKNIVLLHGWGANVNKLKPLAQELKKLNWKILILKLPGFGVQPPKTIWGLSDYGVYVKEATRDAFNGQNYFVFGHSFGGSIALKLGTWKIKTINGIMLFAPGGITRPNIVKRKIFQFLAKLGKIFMVFPAIGPIWKKILYKVVREHDYEQTTGIMREVFKKVISENILEKTSGITTPTLIMWGNNDKVVSAKGAVLLNKAIVNSKMIIFANEGHQFPYMRVKRLAKELNIWAESYL